jgi:sugar/nucleoside kinase (ribokinase family)
MTCWVRFFGSDIRATGVGFATMPAERGPVTGRCFVYVTPDGERTMNTFLGAEHLPLARRCRRGRSARGALRLS